MLLSDDERYRIQAFRNAARQVRDASLIAEGHRIEFVARPGQPGLVDIFIKLLAEEPFRSLAVALRLAYMQGEPAHYNAICNLLYREGDSGTRSRVADLRAQFREILRGKENQVVIGDGDKMAVYTAQQVFEHWLYGVAFHQDQERQESVRLLASVGYAFPLSVQSTGLHLAGRIIDLDDVVADALGENRVARI